MICQEIVADPGFLSVYKFSLLGELFSNEFIYVGRPLLALCYRMWSIGMFIRFLKRKDELRVFSGQKFMIKWLIVFLGSSLVLVASHLVLMLHTWESDSSDLFFTFNTLQLLSVTGLTILLFSPFFFPEVLYGMPRMPVQTSGVGIVPEFDGIMDDMSTKYVQNFEADYLNKISGRIDHGIAKQNMHFNLVKLLNNYAQFKNSIIYHDKTRSTERCNEFLTIIEINNAVVVLTDILNLSAGSSGHLDLYRLLQEYLLDPEKRKKINGIVKSFDL